VAHAEDSKKSAKTKSNNSSPKRCKANISKATAQHSDTYPPSSGDASDPIPLGECEGDCDTDTDCEEALNCRKNGYGTVPGCKRCASGGMSYCYARPDNSDGRPYLWIVDKKVGGDDKIPLGECEGDCDTDTDCEEALNCRLRDKGDDDTVPGCEGKASCKREYCYARPAANSDGLLHLWIVDKKVEGDEKIPLGECEGDCSRDTDCEGALRCRRRAIGDDDPVPGCVGKASGRSNYCYARPAADSDGRPYLWHFDDPETLGKCEGNCKRNANMCQEGLKCFLRNDGNAADPVPGCAGIASFNRNYCVDDDDVMME